MHAEVEISGSIIMCAESTQEHPLKTSGLFVYVEDADQTYELALKRRSHFQSRNRRSGVWPFLWRDRSNGKYLVGNIGKIRKGLKIIDTTMASALLL